MSPPRIVASQAVMRRTASMNSKGDQRDHGDEYGQPQIPRRIQRLLKHGRLPVDSSGHCYIVPGAQGQAQFAWIGRNAMLS